MLLVEGVAKEATKQWSKDLDIPPLSGPASHCQKAWDAHRVSATADTLLKQAPDTVTHSCHLAASAKESGACMHMAECPPYFITGPVHGQQVTLSELLLAFTLAQPCASNTPVTIAGCKLTALPPMASAADGVKADTIAMLPSMTLFTGQ